jgi:4-amino-4-deoxy-L-arabinose transferase-like glycosyltransferase
VNSSTVRRTDPAPPRPKRKRLAATLRSHAGALAIGALFLLLSVVYSIAIPAWEADNELSHFNYVRYIVQQRTLPRAGAQVAGPIMTDVCRSGEERILAELTHQFRQPPLYYLLGALATGWIETDTTGPAAANPFRMWDPFQLGYNFALHDPAQEGPPYTGTLLALHALRLLSGLLGLLGLAATYLLGLLLFAGRRPLAVAMMAVNAFTPQYLFASAIVNNDILIAALSAWCIFWCATVALRAPRLRFLLLAVITAGLAILTKYNAIVLLAPVTLAALVMLASAWRASRKQFLAKLLRAALLIGVVSVPAALWLGRNQALYGQWLGGYAATDNYVGRLFSGLRARSAPDFWDATSYAFSTFWGQFGWDTLTLPPVVIAALAVVSVTAGVGVVLMLADRRQTQRQRGILVAAVLFLLLTVLQSYLRAAGSLEPRGRYLFPALAVICFLLVAGWHRVLPERFKLAGVRVLWAGLLALAVATPFIVLRPAYAPPRLAASAELLEGEQPLHATIGGLAELVGYRVEPQRLIAGEPVEVTLVWRALQATPNNYTLSIHLLDGDKFPRAWVMTHPGRGNFPTSIWQPGDIFRDRYTLYWADTSWEELPSLATLKVALFCPGGPTVEETYLEAADAQGAALGDAVYFGRIKVTDEAQTTAQAPQSTTGYVFGDELALDSIRLTPDTLVAGQDVAIELRWRVLSQPAADYTVFTHVVDASGTQAGGNDQPLTDGYYPSGLWEPGEIITHTQRLRLPPFPPGSRHEIHVGLYEPVSGQRVPLLGAAGQRLPDDLVVAATIITPPYRIFLPVIEHDYGHIQ